MSPNDLRPMDTIVIRDLEVFYHVGVPDEEREQPQRLLLSLSIETDFARAAATDTLEATIDYHALTRWLIRWGSGRSWRLIETLAVDIADHVLRHHAADRVTVEVKKFILPETRYVAVRVARDRPPPD